MKKLVLAISIFFSGIVAVNAQFLYSLGAAVGVSYAKHGWATEPLYFQEQSLLKFNGAILAEFFQNDNYKWRMEIMYNQLGSKEYDLNSKAKYANGTDFISWNNYWMYLRPYYSFTPYFLIGPRIAYLESRSPQIFPEVIGAFYQFHVTGAAGVGLAFNWWVRWRPFIEVFYNHDLMPSYIGKTPIYYDSVRHNTVIFAHDWEFRIGIKYIFKPKNKCPYVDNKADGGYPNNPK